MYTDVLNQCLKELWQSCNYLFFDNQLEKCPIFKIFKSDILAGYFLTGENGAEIWVNVRYFIDLPLEDLIDTLSHEMTHQLQHQTGRPIKHDEFFDASCLIEPAKTV